MHEGAPATGNVWELLDSIASERVNHDRIGTLIGLVSTDSNTVCVMITHCLLFPELTHIVNASRYWDCSLFGTMKLAKL